MMILRSSPASPFARKIRLAAAILGLSDEIELVAADTLNPDAELLRQNPLGKIPALVLGDGRTLYDSAVILEFFDARAGGGKLIPAGEARFATLTRQSLADGMMDAAVLLIYEQRWREPEMRSAKWVVHQRGKVERGLTFFEANPPDGQAKMADAIALAAALGYLDLRFEGAWRAAHPGLAAWLEAFAAKIPAFEATRFRG
jgi:glutathione S-transferase